MGKLLRSLKFGDDSCCWRNTISSGLKATITVAMFVFWGVGQSYAQSEFPCELSINCPANVVLDCGSDVEDLGLTGAPEVSDFNCQGDLIVTHADEVLSGDNNCHVVISRTWTVSIIGGPSQMCTQMIEIVDTDGPVFVDEPADASYQCVGDIPPMPTLEATDCNMVEEIVGFDVQTGFDTLFCTLTTPVGPGPDWAVWLNGLTSLGLASNDYYTWIPGTATMHYYVDGTAYLTGDVRNMSNPSETWTVHFWMENGKNWADWSAMGRSYKDDLGFGAATHTAWTYYELVPVFSHFVGTGDNAGNSLYLSHQPSNYYFGFQFGEGANNRNNHDGGSGWFYYWGWVEGEYVSNHGDLTVDKVCVPVEHPDVNCETTYTRFWRAVDECGNVTFADQNITVEDTTPPVFENCYDDITIECGDEIPAQLPAEGLIAVDNCGGAVTISAIDPVVVEGSNDCHYMLEYGYVAMDSCGNIGRCSYIVNVVDTEYPTLTVPANQVVECNTDIDWGTASAYDVCAGELEVSVSEPMFYEDDCYGYWVVTYTTDDGCDHVVTATQTVDIVDTTDPVFDPYTVDVYVECDQVESVEGLTATDNCDLEVTIDLVEITNSGGCLGVIMRTYTATDDCGNTAEAIQYIHVQDTTPAVIDEPADMDVECDMVPEAPGAEGADVYDNCGYDVTVEFHTEVVEGDCPANYSILWIWEAWDYCENYSTDTTVINVSDNTAPGLWVPQGGVYNCDEEIIYGEASAEDNCDDMVEISHSDTIIAGECPQEYSVIRTWVAVDDCGNSSTASATYWVVDEVAPNWNEQQYAYSYECDEEIPVIQPEAWDNCSENITYDHSDFWYNESDCNGYLARTWSATDECGNTSYFYQYISIYDETAPVISYEPEIELPCDNYGGVYATATDNCDEFVAVEWLNDELVSGGCQGRIMRTYGAWDDCDNYSEVVQIITLTDDVDPWVTEQTPDQTIECGDDMPEVFVSFDDNCDDELSIVSGVFVETIDCIVYYTYTFTATDNCQNSISENVVITVEDTQDPWFEQLPENMTINCDDEVPAITYPNAYDVCDEDVDVEVADEVLPGECPQEYTIVRTYRAYDDCGNEAVESRTITVVDNEAPSFDGESFQYSYECDEEIELIQPVATDNCSEVIVYDHTDFWYVESDCYGSMVRTWTATDECGNTGYYYQYISIYDNTAPVFAGEIEIDMPCDQISNEILVTATDNCDEEVYIEILSDELASGGCAGRIIRTYRAWDNCENWSDFTQFITLIDNVAPVASMDPEDASYECDEEWSAPQVTFTDNCDEELTLLPDLFIATDGCTTTYHYIWTAIDHCDNATTVEATYTVSDYTAPTAVEYDDITVECGTEYIVLVPSFSDNCDMELDYDSGSSEEMVDCNRVITYWWTATDDCDHTTYVDWVVTIEDTTPPMLYTPFGGEYSCDEDIVYGEAQAYDLCDEDVVPTYTDSLIPGSCPQSYTLIRTWTVSDDCGNTSTGSAWYYVYDNEAPEFTSVPESVTIECSDDIPASEASAVDNCDELVDVTQVDNYYYQSECYSIIIRTFTATDDCENSSTAEQWIYIQDTTDPIITGEFEIEMPCDDISEGIFVSATDNCDDDVYIEIVSDEVASGGCAGRIIRTYRAWDNCQNYAEFVQFITLIDETAPVASIDPEDMTIECGMDWIPAMVTFEDNCDEELIIIDDLFMTQEACTTSYHYIWIATDHCDNSTTVDQWIHVVDTTAPVIDDQDSESTVACNVIVDFVIPMASDLCDESVEVVPSYESIPGQCPGEYTEVITFTATDDCGNTSSVTHTVHHVDEVAPTLTDIPTSMELECDEEVPSSEPGAYDYCSDATVMSNEWIEEGWCANSYTIVREFWAVDECGNESEPVYVYYWIYDATAPVFETEFNDENYECIDWASYEPQAASAVDNCGEVTITVEISEETSDECGNGWWYVGYVAVDDCDNYSNSGYWIHVDDTQAPELSEYPASVVLDCGDEIPAAPEVSATDNCDEVTVTMTETCIGDCPEEGNTDCDLITPVRPAGNICNYPVDWAMALFAMPQAHKWYQLVPGTGSLTNNGDGTVSISGTLVNAYDANCGFYFSVNFGSEMDWNAWSAQALPHGFKDDCGGVGANHEDWLYYILQAGEGAELIGWGTYSGSSIDLTHAPVNQYFGFQYGEGANNYNAENGFGGWFNYHGTFLVNGEPIMSGFAAGAGDFAFEVDCCPDYQIVRCWTAMDCSGNETSWCQTITFGDLIVTAPQVAAQPEIEADKGEIAIVSIMPNPATDRSMISFMSKQSGRLSLQILDMTGRVVADLYNNNVEGGVVYNAEFNADQLSSGMYMVRLNSGTEVDIDRVQIAK
ncbi:MAG: T9SS type A sorting domain-containing protein [Flavobacteriales bacterium]|nr:T9SS type A sorting domain-containing protein [Flavobacteriales bacterium]